MNLTVRNHGVYCYTGGRPFDAAKPTAVFIHGVLNDHSVWILQTRYLAHHGWNVLALDLPGHGKSGGEPPADVEDAAGFVAELLDAAGIQKAALIGHSFGSLIALEAAARFPDRVSQLVLAGTAAPMRVSPALLDASRNAPMKGIDVVNTYSHSMLAPPPSTLGPGTWVYGGSRALMRRVLAGNTKVNVFHAGFVACDGYTGGDAAMERVACPVLFVLGRDDQMTPPKAARSLQSRAKNGKTVLLDCGHSIVTEAPDGMLCAFKDFLTP